jgi:signal transduction histidine kinase
MPVTEAADLTGPAATATRAGAMTRGPVLLAALAGAAATVLEVLASYRLWHTHVWAGRVDLSFLIPITAVGVSFLAAGIAGMVRRPASRVGALMVAAGLAWFAPVAIQAIPLGILWSLSSQFETLFLVLLAHLFVSFPTGRLRTRWDRNVMVGVYAWAVLTTVATLLTWNPVFQGQRAFEHNVFYVFGSPHLNDMVSMVSDVGTAAAVVLLAGTVLRHWLRATKPGRRALAPVLWATAPTGAWVILDQLTSGVLASARLWFAVHRLGYLIMLALPFGFLIGLLRVRLGRGAVGNLVVELGGGAKPRVGLREALARVLGDPSLQILYRVHVAADSEFVDEAGRPASLPDGNGRSVTILDSEGTPIAALIHDLALENEPELLESAAAAARLAIDNARLQAEVRSQLRQVQASRARIVEAGDRERRRVERNLHDGAQQRLVTLSMALGMIRDRAATSAQPDLTRELDDAIVELRGAIGDLRHLARGIHPAVLTNEGLGAALESLAARSSVPVSVRYQAPRCAEAVEVTAYFVVAEGLANVAKHAHATGTTVTVTKNGGGIRVEVADDGVGGVSTEVGSGLRGLEDRVAALGGTFGINSPPGRGTRLVAELPTDAG